MDTPSDFRAYELGTARSYPVGAIEISYTVQPVHTGPCANRSPVCAVIIIWSRVNYTQNNTNQPSRNRNLSTLNTGLIIFQKCINCIVFHLSQLESIFDIFLEIACGALRVKQVAAGDVTSCFLPG